ncbi:hypothetical protein BJ138DRAFT_1005044 [Hygrophoropsis aurantiaca]|uniref:Uncharacterized protein n=1 Tax=Hygrophoropsis aurantiaca TaxID=72124 RepID=A0ACB8AG75_9AGAM|nr:hypothetical protein BJ138DRAFT_1005044 [Hygrophoropsis aurantiaca]
MDSTGWHAQRRARKDSERYAAVRRGADGRFQGVEEAMPMPDNGPFVGGFYPPPSPSPGTPPPVPPKSHHTGFFASPLGHPAPNYDGPSTRPHQLEHASSISTSSNLSQLSPVERSRVQRLVRMEPHLQLMVGPLLCYDTMDENGLWHGAALIVTADSGSVYEPYPVLTYQWDPEEQAMPPGEPRAARSFDLGPHPADPHATALSGFPSGPEADYFAGDRKKNPDQTQHVTGQEIYVYAGNGGTFTFWRFLIQLQLGDNELRIKYSINGGMQLCFTVPARNQNMRWAAHSCNGFSAGVNQDEFRGPGFKNGYDPMWIDLLQKHAQEPFHVLVGGGDQLYCDSLTREPEMQDWVTQQKPEGKKNYPLTQEIAQCIDRFFFNHYCSSFRNGAFARANSSIPMLNMCVLTAHNVIKIDGFGSYPEDLQKSPVFSAIGSRGYFFFLLFQCFINPAIDGLDDRRGRHVYNSLILGAPGPYVGVPSHSRLSYLGPNVWILLLDCRAERKKDQVCSPFEYQKVFDCMKNLPPGVEHLIVQVGIPIAYPRLVFLETALDSKFNPLTALGRSGALGLGSFVNKFNAEAELLDDLNDHWTAKAHKKERNWLIQQLQGFAKTKRIRVSFLSGDVHCAAVGELKTLVRGNGRNSKTIEAPPATDFRYMINVVTSAIVNTPPPNGVITMVSTLATKTHRTMHYAETDETMYPLFSHEPDGTSRKNKFIMGRRNWCAAWWDFHTGEMVFDIRVEREKGVGDSVSYPVRTPPPRWLPGS